MIRHVPLRRSPLRRRRRGVPLSVRAQLLERCQGRCERCRLVKPLDPHHRVKRSQGGKDELGNLFALCRECHDDIEQHPKQAVADGWTTHLGKVA